ncbi:MAG TPA: MFS transporter, partial [Kiloniellales bacterium]|nr:MFS transporter [Kiloniellales bacterium]
MLQLAPTLPMQPPAAQVAFRRSLLIGLIAFLTLVDLFAAQAILPSLAQRYAATPAAIGVAVNASTFGMAIAGLAVALLGRRVDRRRGVWLSLALLAVPTALLAVAPDLATFSLLRIAQGLCMATAFSLTMAYLAERCSAAESATALAAYITGAVASNLIGRLSAGALVGSLGLEANFHAFALLNLAGALLAWRGLKAAQPMEASTKSSAWAAWLAHLRNPALAAAFAIGFLILFAFIGTFTYANFVLAAPPIGLGAMRLGFVYFVFLPSLLTTPFAGRLALRCGTRRSLAAGLALALLGLPLMLRDELVSFLAGMVLVGVGTFFAQAVATGFVGRAAERDRAAASGLYLASYYLGGLAGAAVIGLLFQMAGWTAAVGGIALSLLLAIALS